MLKVELHAHTDGDPKDRISHTVGRLIEHAASLGYHGLAITLHDRYFDPRPHAAAARASGVVLLSGIELTINRRHLLLVNFPPAVVDARTFDDVRRLKRGTSGLVVVPHPFYPIPSALGGRLLAEHADFIDALEINAMYTSWLDFNRRAVSWARAHGKPLVGNTDLHLLPQMGTTYSVVDAAPDPDAICESIRAGRVEVCTRPLPTLRAAGLFSQMCLTGLVGRLRR
ncbi:MAG TPA: PHP-associated domain-containing protein [Vicinamibacterales bacterium]|nr:PHP-associated domain-containing protein [Vicinamibacterales bacterium]